MVTPRHLDTTRVHSTTLHSAEVRNSIRCFLQLICFAVNYVPGRCTTKSTSTISQKSVDRLGKAIEAAEEEMEGALRRTTDVHRSQLRQKELELSELQRVLQAKERSIDSLRDTLSTTKRTYETRLSQTESALSIREAEVNMHMYTAGHTWTGACTACYHLGPLRWEENACLRLEVFNMVMRHRKCIEVLMLSWVNACNREYVHMQPPCA
jgi:hypothetical protein